MGQLHLTFGVCLLTKSIFIYPNGTLIRKPNLQTERKAITMRGESFEVTLNKIGKDTLTEPLKETVTIPVADKEDDFGSWKKVFDNWPKSLDFAKPDLAKVMREGLSTLARREKVASMIKSYREASGKVAGKKGRASERTEVKL